MKSEAQALALTAVITSASIEPTPFHLRSSRPIYAQARRRREPLDLDATVFCYREMRDGSIQPLREVTVAMCRCARCRR